MFRPSCNDLLPEWGVRSAGSARTNQRPQATHFMTTLNIIFKGWTIMLPGTCQLSDPLQLLDKILSRRNLCMNWSSTFYAGSIFSGRPKAGAAEPVKAFLWPSQLFCWKPARCIVPCAWKTCWLMEVTNCVSNSHLCSVGLHPALLSCSRHTFSGRKCQSGGDSHQIALTSW